MKKNTSIISDKKLLREKIMHSAIASFAIEGIKVPTDKAFETLKKVELSLGK